MDATRSIRARLVARDKRAAQALKAETQDLSRLTAVWEWELSDVDAGDANLVSTPDTAYLMDWDSVDDCTPDTTFDRVLFYETWGCDPQDFVD